MIICQSTTGLICVFTLLMNGRNPPRFLLLFLIIKQGMWRSFLSFLKRKRKRRRRRSKGGRRKRKRKRYLILSLLLLWNLHFCIFIPNLMILILMMNLYLKSIGLSLYLIMIGKIIQLLIWKISLVLILKTM